MPPAENIAVLLPNWVGDVVMATPALRALRSHFGESRITHIARPAALEVVGGHDPNLPHESGRIADEQMTDRSGSHGRALNFIGVVRGTRRERFDLAVLLPNSFRSALLCWLGGVRRIVGYDRDGRGWMLSERLSPPRDERGNFAPTPQIDYYNALPAALGAEANSRKMSLPLNEEGEAEAAALLEDAGVNRSRPLVMLNPGASFGPSKLWVAERFAAVADALVRRRGAQIVINAAPRERTTAAAVAHAMDAPPVINFAERDNSISLLKSLIRRCSVLITNDTGARHIAAATGIGVVTIFGSTDPEWTRIDYPRERILRADVPCSPCRGKRCPLPAGPDHHQCMTGISVLEVLTAAEQLLDPPADPTGGDPP